VYFHVSGVCRQCIKSPSFFVYSTYLFCRWVCVDLMVSVIIAAVVKICSFEISVMLYYCTSIFALMPVFTALISVSGNACIVLFVLLVCVQR